MNLHAKLQLYPPVLLRCLARDADGHALSDSDLAERGLALPTLRRLSCLTSWDYVFYGEMRDFMLATGCDLEDRAVFKRLQRYVGDAKFVHLQRHPDWLMTFKPLLKLYLNSIR